MIHIIVDPYLLSPNDYGRALIESGLWRDALISGVQMLHDNEKARIPLGVVHLVIVLRLWKLFHP